PSLALYLLQVNLALLLFYIGYRLLLRNYTFYTINRYYLLLALFYSAIYPLLDFKELLHTFSGSEKLEHLAKEWQGSIYLIMDPVESTGNYWQTGLTI